MSSINNFKLTFIRYRCILGNIICKTIYLIQNCKTVLCKCFLIRDDKFHSIPLLPPFNTTKPTILIILHWLLSFVSASYAKITFFMNFGFASYKIAIISTFAQAFGVTRVIWLNHGEGIGVLRYSSTSGPFYEKGLDYTYHKTLNT